MPWGKPRRRPRAENFVTESAVVLAGPFGRSHTTLKFAVPECVRSCLTTLVVCRDLKPRQLYASRDGADQLLPHGQLAEPCGNE